MVNEGQMRDFDALMVKGASWSQAISYCLSHPVGYSFDYELSAVVQGETGE